MKLLPRTGGLRTLATHSALALLFVCLGSAMANARIPDTCASIRPQDEVWLISTRKMGSIARPSLACNPKFQYQRFCCDCGWINKSACDFQESYDPCATTVIYVHGNRMTPEWTRRRGLDLYNGLKCGADDRPIRYVIWSWPSSPIPLRVAIARDARVKLRRTPLQSYYLGWWMHHCCKDCRVSMVGYSFGARTIVGALHLLGGGTVAGRCLANPNCCRRPRIRVALWAAATQSNWLLPGQPHSRALSCVDRGVIFYNRLDPALKRFPRILCSATGPALGYQGLTCPQRGPASYARISQYDVTNYIGRHHDWNLYRDCAWTMNCTRNLVLSWPSYSQCELERIQIQRIASLAPIIGTFH